MASREIALMAHLMRRAGFGATRDELEDRVAKGYEATVEELLCSNDQHPGNRYELLRYHPWAWSPGTPRGMGAAEWFYSMISTIRPLEEKMTLFWHSVFAVGVSKVDHYRELTDMISMFRQKGLGDYRELLLEIAKNPAMIYWLDNHENHADSINENWGRELLELFSMGVDNYTEVDVRECARAFTGWTIAHHLPRFPLTRFQWEFEYREQDHDDGEKTFLGETGRFNGDDIIRIICEQPLTSRFIARHLYNFFVADEAPVPAWTVTPPLDPEAIELLAGTLADTNYDIGSTLRVLFNSDFFKEARFARLKSPAEVVVGTLRLVGGVNFPSPGIGDLSRQTANMGQELLNPPTVEGWHTGTEWISISSLSKRVNFATQLVSDLNRPGIKSILDRLKDMGDLHPEQLVDACLDFMGPVEAAPENRRQLIDLAGEHGQLRWGTKESSESSTNTVIEILRFIVALREYQYA